MSFLDACLEAPRSMKEVTIGTGLAGDASV